MLDPVAAHEFRQHVRDFRRDYLTRALVFLGVAIWAISAVLLLLTSSVSVLAMAGAFEALCVLVYLLSRRDRLAWAEEVFVVGLVLWAPAVAWVGRDPALLVLCLVFAPVITVVVNPPRALAATALLVIGELLVERSLPPGLRLTWPTFAIPLGTVMVAGLALIRDINFTTILEWALHSTRSAIERLAEVQEHRARLHRNMKDLDNAYHRLERANEMLTAARAEAEEARQARNQFALSVSHELRTPLNFIIGFSELMVNAPATYGPVEKWPAALYDDIQEIYHSSKHLLQLVDDILDLGKAEAHRLVLIKEWVAPAAIVEEAAAIMQAAMTAQGLWLKAEVESDLPQVFVDRTRIRQVLLNLLGNSLRFTRQGGITVSVCRAEEGMLFCVRDTGPGIAAHEIPKVFEEFGQANATVWRRRNGSGLGVPISRRFVTMHGGKMWLESEVGEGSSFYFTLPTVPTEPAWQPELDMDAYWRFMAEQNRAPHLVIVLSPEPGAEDMVQHCVPGYQVIATGDAVTAGKQIERLLPQALIVDQNLLDRPAISTLIQDLPYDLPVLAFKLPGRSARLELPPGVSDYLIKPVLREDLLKALRRVGGQDGSVLAVDDDPAMLRFVSVVLQSAEIDKRAQVITAGSGAEALEALKLLVPPAAEGKERKEDEARAARGPLDGTGTSREIPVTVFLDLGLPDMSGWDVLARMQATPEWCAVPVILMTGVGLAEELEARERKVLQISTSRWLTDNELAAAVGGLLQAVPPKFPVNGTAARPPGIHSASPAS